MTTNVTEMRRALEDMIRQLDLHRPRFGDGESYRCSQAIKNARKALAALQAPEQKPEREASRYHFTDAKPLAVETIEGTILLGDGWLAISEEEYRALNATPPTAPVGDLVSREAYWLIERRCSPPQFSAEQAPTGWGCFKSDVMHAHRFPTRAAAIEALRRLHENERAECIISEHIDVALPPASSAPVEQSGIDGALVERLRGLLAKATPLPWKHYNEVFRSQFSNRRAIEVQRKDGKPIVNWSGFDGLPPVTARKANANAALIVEAVNNLETLLAALSANRTDGAGIPEGMVAVPVEPTEAMIGAASAIDIEVLPTNVPSGLTGTSSTESRAIYRAMLAARPTTPLPATGGEGS